jgi:hypothetical protein
VYTFPKLQNSLQSRIIEKSLMKALNGTNIYSDIDNRSSLAFSTLSGAFFVFSEKALSIHVLLGNIQ